jgi:hypothetical protein
MYSIAVWGTDDDAQGATHEIAKARPFQLVGCRVIMRKS